MNTASDDGELSKTSEGALVPVAKLQGNEPVDSCRTEGDSIASRKQSRQKRRPDRYTPQKGDKGDDSDKGECCCNKPKCVACRPKLALRRKILQSPEFERDVEWIYGRAMEVESENEDWGWDNEHEELYRKVKNTRRQRILRSSLDELKSEFTKLNLK